MTEDSKSLDRAAQFLHVRCKKGLGSPPQYEADWQPVYDAKVEQLTDNINANPSEAVFWLPPKRWNEPVGLLDLLQGDKVQLVTETGDVIFEGFIVKILRQFSGGDEKGGKYERIAFICYDYRWALASMSPYLRPNRPHSGRL